MDHYCISLFKFSLNKIHFAVKADLYLAIATDVNGNKAGIGCDAMGVALAQVSGSRR